MSENKEVRKPLYYLAEEFNLFWEDSPTAEVKEVFRIFAEENDLSDAERSALVVYLKLEGCV